MLYLIATPIGNLEDITYRAVRILKSSDRIYCEDTRKSKILLNHYEIHKPLSSYHKFSEKRQLETFVDQLKQDEQISLICDSGTPGICDPGEQIIQACIEKEIPFTLIPGACSLISALVLSGLQTLPFQFLGFLPKKRRKKRR